MPSNGPTVLARLKAIDTNQLARRLGAIVTDQNIHELKSRETSDLTTVIADYMVGAAIRLG